MQKGYTYQNIIVKVIVGAPIGQLSKSFHLRAKFFIEIEQLKSGVFECTKLGRKY